MSDKVIVCLECGRRLKMLAHHIKTAHGIDPVAYRAKWRLPEAYPMIAREAARRRSHTGKPKPSARS